MYVFKRLLLMAVGYLVAVIIGLISVAAVAGMLVSVIDAPDAFAAMAAGAWIAIIVPVIGLYAVGLTVVMTCVQALLTTFLSEIFVIRHVALHALFGVLVAISGILLITPSTGSFVGIPFGLELGVIAAGGLSGGLIYWLIAGRNAGFRRPYLQPA